LQLTTAKSTLNKRDEDKLQPNKQQSHPFVMPRPGKKGFCVLVDECRRKIDDCVHKIKQIKKKTS